MDEHKCENCGKDCEVLYGKGPYAGNTDTRMMCSECYSDTFEEDI